MSDLHMGMAESRFAEIIWNDEPIRTADLTRKAAQELKWKKTTSYTVLKRLCEKGIFRNADGIVTSVISREHFYAMQSQRFVEETFSGSLPAFLAAFTRTRALSGKERQKILAIIEKGENDK